jgi:hypothetical protein
MPNTYAAQPKLTDEEAGEFLERHAMRLTEWPQVLLPEQILNGYRTQVLENAGFMKGCELDLATINELTDGSLTDARLPHAILRTRWGALVAWFEYRGEDEPSHLNVEVHCEKAWGHPELEEVQENFLDLICGAIEQFDEISKEDPPASKAELGVDLSFIGALGDVCVEVPAKATEKEKREAGEKLAMFLAGMLNSGYFGELLEESFKE